MDKEKRSSFIKTQVNKRDYGLECLRVVLMLMIPMLHFNSHGGMSSFYSMSEPGWYVMKLLTLASMCAVNVFVLISGYFSVDKKLNVHRVAIIVCAIWFYSYSWLLIGKFFGIVNYDTKSLLTALLPVSFKLYWFPTCYICLLIISPFLNRLINGLTVAQYKSLLIIGFLMLSLWHDLIPVSDPLNANGGYSVIWFIYLYCTAGYIKLHGENLLNYKPKAYAIAYVVVTILMFVAAALLTLLSNRFKLIANYNIHENLTKYCSVLTLIQSIALFLLFKKITIKNTIIIKIVQFFAPLTFGVYLIHDNASARNFIYYNVFKVDTLPHSFYAIFIVIGMVVALFICCSLIEYVRKSIFSLWENKAWFKRLFAGLQSRIDNF